METLCLSKPWMHTDPWFRRRTFDIGLLVVAVALVLILVALALLPDSGSGFAGGARWLPERAPFDAAMSVRSSIRVGPVTLTLGWPSW